jgi:phage tail sheath protein FI
MDQRPATAHGRYTGIVLPQGRVRLDGHANGWTARIAASFGHGLSIAPPGPTPAVYVGVRRLTQQIEDALYSRLAWAAFEPNDQPLWLQLRVAASNYLMGLYQAGTLVGSSPQQAFFTRCDDTTTTQAEIASGQINLMVGFAPCYPAQFVLLVIGLTAGGS